MSIRETLLLWGLLSELVWPPSRGFANFHRWATSPCQRLATGSPSPPAVPVSLLSLSLSRSSPFPNSHRPPSSPHLLVSLPSPPQAAPVPSLLPSSATAATLMKGLTEGMICAYLF